MKIRTIVLDDDYTIRTLTCDILKERGYVVYAFSEPFFVITDINMPNMSGLEFIEHQKSMGCIIQKAAVMSGMWTNGTLAHANRLGCRTFNKPFKLDEIRMWSDECEKGLGLKNKLLKMSKRLN